MVRLLLADDHQVGRFLKVGQAVDRASSSMLGLLKARMQIGGGALEPGIDEDGKGARKLPVVSLWSERRREGEDERCIVVKLLNGQAHGGQYCNGVEMVAGVGLRARGGPFKMTITVLWMRIQGRAGGGNVDRVHSWQT